MLRHLPLCFLQQKIKELETALFYALSDDLLKMPVRIIRSIHVDEVGQIWYLLPMPRQSLKEFSREFQCRLDFFRKQKEFSLRVSGRSYLVTDPEDLNSSDSIDPAILEQAAKGEAVLVKMKIQRADYQEIRKSRPGLLPQTWNKALTLLERHRQPAMEMSASFSRGRGDSPPSLHKLGY